MGVLNLQQLTERRLSFDASKAQAFFGVRRQSEGILAVPAPGMLNQQQGWFPMAGKAGSSCVLSAGVTRPTGV